MQIYFARVPDFNENFPLYMQNKEVYKWMHSKNFRLTTVFRKQENCFFFSFSCEIKQLSFYFLERCFFTYENSYLFQLISIRKYTNNKLKIHEKSSLWSTWTVLTAQRSAVVANFFVPFRRKEKLKLLKKLTRLCIIIKGEGGRECYLRINIYMIWLLFDRSLPLPS